MRTFEELLNTEDPAWPEVLEWISEATNIVEILPPDTARAADVLVSTQVTTRSPMGAIIYHTGGLLIDHGWIRILASGHPRLNRTLSDWNHGKTFREYGQTPGWWLIADDAIGGLFAVNGGYFGEDTPGNVYYFVPDTLAWECLDLTYTGFLLFCFGGDLSGFYEGYRWNNWSSDTANLPGDQVFNFYPPLWTKEGKELSQSSRRVISVEEQYKLNMDMREQLL